MADWRQVQARIRKAKAATDPTAQLTELYERTRDAMVAFELGTLQEKAGDTAEAVRWYTSAAERFRRAQWRTKAEEALTRLGAPIPTPLPEKPATSRIESRAADEPALEAASSEAGTGGDSFESQLPGGDDMGNVVASDDNGGQPTSNAASSAASGAASGAAAGASAAQTTGRKRRHRGRRGGRRRRGERGKPAAAGAAVTDEISPSAESSQPAAEPARIVRSPTREHYAPAAPSRESAEHGAPAAAPLWQGRARAGEPALASRIAQLESQLRRLLACPLASLDDADQAPAGPGVLLLSDSDQHTHYYIEACQTLRIGIGNLSRGGRGSKEASRLKECMAENLGIAEARVSKYLKDHCGVRWLQLDEGAPELSHFATAVLRPIVKQ
jgi:hypothetical protein